VQCLGRDFVVWNLVVASVLRYRRESWTFLSMSNRRSSRSEFSPRFRHVGCWTPCYVEPRSTFVLTALSTFRCLVFFGLDLLGRCELVDEGVVITTTKALVFRFIRLRGTDMRPTCTYPATPFYSDIRPMTMHEQGFLGRRSARTQLHCASHCMGVSVYDTRFAVERASNRARRPTLSPALSPRTAVGDRWPARPFSSFFFSCAEMGRLSSQRWSRRS